MGEMIVRTGWDLNASTSSGHYIDSTMSSQGPFNPLRCFDPFMTCILTGAGSTDTIVALRIGGIFFGNHQRRCEILRYELSPHLPPSSCSVLVFGGVWTRIFPSGECTHYAYIMHINVHDTNECRFGTVWSHLLVVECQCDGSATPGAFRSSTAAR